VAAIGLGGAAMAAPIVRDDAIAVLEEEQHVRVPIIGRQRPAMAEHEGLPLAPVLVEDLDAVFRGDRAHVRLPLLERGSRSKPRANAHATVGTADEGVKWHLQTGQTL